MRKINLTLNLVIGHMIHQIYTDPLVETVNNQVHLNIDLANMTQHQDLRILKA